MTKPLLRAKKRTQPAVTLNLLNLSIANMTHEPTPSLCRLISLIMSVLEGSSRDVSLPNYSPNDGVFAG